MTRPVTDWHDVLEFRFYPTGHWIVRSEFKQSCIPYEDTGPNKIGFSSGAVDVQTTSNNVSLLSLCRFLVSQTWTSSLT